MRHIKIFWNFDLIIKKIQNLAFNNLNDTLLYINVWGLFAIITEQSDVIMVTHIPKAW